MTPADDARTSDTAGSGAIGGKVEKRPHWLLLYVPPVAVLIGALFHHHII